MLKNPNEELLKEEKEIQVKINTCIDNNESIIFKAGAGSGKTYTLIESLKHLILTKADVLNAHKQKIVVITYTNAASNEVKKRLGHSELVLVSTIHERIWDLILHYQRELVDIHKSKLQSEIGEINKELAREKKFAELSDEIQRNLIEVMSKDRNRKIFNDNYTKNAAQFRNAIQNITFTFQINETDLLKNVAVFKKIVSSLLRKSRYEKAINKIKIKDIEFNESNDYNKSYDKFNKIEYNIRNQQDRLEHMKISHDTLLEYGKKLIKKRKLLQRIIVDKYPYYFIDEYQDTNEDVVEFLSMLDEYSKSNNRNYFVGYFGDEMQKIYSTGVGNKLTDIHQNLEVIRKEFNRRSTNAIIDVTNRLGNDEAKQKSIFTDADGGNISFYKGNREDIRDFINFQKKRSDGPINSLILTNKDIAEFIGIKHFYNIMNESPLYKPNYERLNPELLSKDYEKLGDVPKTLFNLFRIINLFENKRNAVSELLDSLEIKTKITLNELNKLISDLDLVSKENTVEDILNKLNEIASKEDNSKLIFNQLMYKILLSSDRNNIEKKGVFKAETYKGFLRIELGNIYNADDMTDEEYDEKIEKANETVEELMKIKKIELLNWYQYLTVDDEKADRFHTYHGTKGLEYENVVLIMENKFGRTKSYFDHYFKNRQVNESLKDKEKEKYEDAKNLLYVATSRAKRNLAIFYIDEIDDFKDEIIEMFGEPKVFSKEIQV